MKRCSLTRVSRPYLMVFLFILDITWKLQLLHMFSRKTNTLFIIAGALPINILSAFPISLVCTSKVLLWIVSFFYFLAPFQNYSSCFHWLFWDSFSEVYWLNDLIFLIKTSKLTSSKWMKMLSSHWE